MPDISENLKKARIYREYSSPADAADSLGWNLNTYKSNENGTRGTSVSVAAKYARGFRVSLQWLLLNEGHIDDTNQTQIVGYVGEGSEITPIDDHERGGGLELVDIPPGADLEVVAVRVKGDSMYPAYRNNDVLYYSAHAPDEAGFLNKECVVALLDGRKFVKVVERGSASGTYNLASHNAPTILDQQIEWAAPVEWVKRG